MKISHISQTEMPKGDEIRGRDIREGKLFLIKSEHPDFDTECYITLEELNHCRRLYLASLIVQENGEIARIDKDVMDAIKNNAILSENIQDDLEAELTVGQKIADRVAVFGGTGKFVSSNEHSC